MSASSALAGGPAAPPPAAAATPPPALPTFEDFLAWALQADARAEWVAGEVVVMPPGSPAHQDLLGFLYELINGYVRRRQLGRVYFAPVVMKLATRPSGREPDLLFVSGEHADRLRETHVDGPADLVVEIISPESDARDRGEKFVEYEAAGISEYWLIDPLRQEATFYRRGEDGRYHPAPVAPDGVYCSHILPGFWLRVAWLWQLPDAAAALAELGLQ
jgi:Uma2 family endonuclease